MVEEQRVERNKMRLKTRLSQNIFYYCQFLVLVLVLIILNNFYIVLVYEFDCAIIPSEQKHIYYIKVWV